MILICKRKTEKPFHTEKLKVTYILNSHAQTGNVLAWLFRAMSKRAQLFVIIGIIRVQGK